MNSTKVFVIGFQKTGTTSLGKALEGLGYSVCGVVGADDVSPESEAYREKINCSLSVHDAFQDNPWCILYKELDNRFPGSKFILTLRPTEKWILSVVNHFGSTYRPLTKWIYGVDYPVGNEQVFIDRYERHNAEVLEYFADRKNDLLVISSKEDYSWKKICGFLDKPEPDLPFPYSNRSKFPLKNRTAISIKNFLLRK